MPDLTPAFAKIFDATRLVGTRDPAAPLELLDADSNSLDVISSGFNLEPRQDGAGGQEHVMEFLITDRPGLANTIGIAERFGWSGVLFERIGSASPPTGNPGLWTIRVKPIGRRP